MINYINVNTNNNFELRVDLQLDFCISKPEKKINRKCIFMNLIGTAVFILLCSLISQKIDSGFVLYEQAVRISDSEIKCKQYQIQNKGRLIIWISSRPLAKILAENKERKLVESVQILGYTII